MFDVSWSELLVLGLVTLIFVGPKELPRFLNTLGRYVGVVRRQANEFRSVFEQAMREAEMEELKKDVRSVTDSVKSSLDGVTRSVDDVKTSVQANLDAASMAASVSAKPKDDVPAVTADGQDSKESAPEPVEPEQVAPEKVSEAGPSSGADTSEAEAAPTKDAASSSDTTPSETKPVVSEDLSVAHKPEAERSL